MSKLNISLILWTFLALSLGLLTRVARAELNTTLTVSTTTDVVDGNDGECSLREAVIAANRNMASGGMVGECPAGSDSITDVIMLAEDQTYLLSIVCID